MAAAEKAVADNTGASDSRSYGLNQVSLLQRSRLESRVDLANSEALQFIRNRV